VRVKVKSEPPTPGARLNFDTPLPNTLHISKKEINTLATKQRLEVPKGYTVIEEDGMFYPAKLYESGSHKKLTDDSWDENEISYKTWNGAVGYIQRLIKSNEKVERYKLAETYQLGNIWLNSSLPAPDEVVEAYEAYNKVLYAYLKREFPEHYGDDWDEEAS
jgi:hypothetical protein